MFFFIKWLKKNHKKILYINRIWVFATSCFITVTHEMTMNEKLNMIDLKGSIEVKNGLYGNLCFSHCWGSYPYFLFNMLLCYIILLCYVTF